MEVDCHYNHCPPALVSYHALHFVLHDDQPDTCHASEHFHVQSVAAACVADAAAAGEDKDAVFPHQLSTGQSDVDAPPEPKFFVVPHELFVAASERAELPEHLTFVVVRQQSVFASDADIPLQHIACLELLALSFALPDVAVVAQHTSAGLDHDIVLFCSVDIADAGVHVQHVSVEPHDHVSFGAPPSTSGTDVCPRHMSCVAPHDHSFGKLDFAVPVQH